MDFYASVNIEPGVCQDQCIFSASDTLSLTSGRDTHLRGAQGSGKTVNADVGRDLNIQSQQDTATYDSKHTSGGFQASLCVPPFCYGQTVSGSGGINQQNVTATYQSVNQPSGMYAGDGGYHVNVGNHTQLDGGAIASTASADKNRLSTQTFAYADLENKASYSGTDAAVNILYFTVGYILLARRLNRCTKFVWRIALGVFVLNAGVAALAIALARKVRESCLA